MVATADSTDTLSRSVSGHRTTKPRHRVVVDVMTYLSEPDGEGECYRCEQARETATHTIHFFDDRDSKRVDLCPTCVRTVHEADNPVRSIT